METIEVNKINIKDLKIEDFDPNQGYVFIIDVGDMLMGELRNYLKRLKRFFNKGGIKKIFFMPSSYGRVGIKFCELVGE